MPQTELQKLIRLIFTTKHLMFHRLKCDPISLLQAEALSHIVEMKNCTMKDIAEHFHITPPSATALIDALTQKKLLKRNVDDNDRRLVRLTITEKGKKFSRDNQKLITKQMAEIFKELTEADIQALIKIHEKIKKVYNNNNLN